MNKRKVIYLALALVFLGFNLYLLLHLLIIHPIGGYFGIFFYMAPMLWVTMLMGKMGVFFVSLIFISAMATTIVRAYPAAIYFSFIGGILTIPIGILGIIASIFIDNTMNMLICPNCAGILTRKGVAWGLAKCRKCSMIYIVGPLSRRK